VSHPATWASEARGVHELGARTFNNGECTAAVVFDRGGTQDRASSGTRRAAARRRSAGMGNELSCCEPTPQGGFKNAPIVNKAFSKQRLQTGGEARLPDAEAEAWHARRDPVTNWGAKGVPANFDAQPGPDRWGVAPAASFDAAGAYETHRRGTYNVSANYSSQVRADGGAGENCAGEARAFVAPVTVCLPCHPLPFACPRTPAAAVGLFDFKGVAGSARGHPGVL